MTEEATVDPGPIYGERPSLDAVHALLRRRINIALRLLRDGDDWRGSFTVRPILRHATSINLRPYRLRQWAVWVNGEEHPIGYIQTSRSFHGVSHTGMKFMPYGLTPSQYEIDVQAEQSSGAGHAAPPSS